MWEGCIIEGSIDGDSSLAVTVLHISSVSIDGAGWFDYNLPPGAPAAAHHKDNKAGTLVDKDAANGGEQ